MNEQEQFVTTPIEITTQSINKDVIEKYAHILLQDVEDGNVHPQEAALRIKFMEDVIATIKDQLRPHVLKEMHKYSPNEKIYFQGQQFEFFEAATKYDYESCQDPEYTELTTAIAELTAKRKDREKFLKTIKSPMTIVDEATGEIKTINPPIKSSTTSFKITWKK